MLEHGKAPCNTEEMNPVARLTRYANAWTQFDKIQRLTLDSCSLEDIVDEVFRYANGFFAPVQHREEFLGALRLVAEAKPRYIVEVGTSLGELFCSGRESLIRKPLSSPSTCREATSAAVPLLSVSRSSAVSACPNRSYILFGPIPTNLKPSN